MDTQKIYRTAIYARRKFTDIICEDEPDPTTAAQVKQSKAFLSELPEIQVTGVYTDTRKMKQDGSRPEFFRMIKDIQNGNIDCVVMTSMDSFAKDHAETKYYLLNLFAVIGLRIISILDDYDSLISESGAGSYTKLEELVHQVDIYSRSRLLSKRAKQKRNDLYLELTMTPYGYLYNPDTPSNLDLDPETYKYVQYIFKEYLSGTNRNQIARSLTEMGAPSPSKRKEQLGIEYKKTQANDYWHSSSINAILQNPSYVGDLVFGQRRAAQYVFRDCNKHHWTGKTEVITDHHEAIISREDFARANAMFDIMRDGRKKKEVKNPAPAMLPTPFRNLVYCGRCGGRMNHTRYVSCRTPYSAYRCTSHTMHLPDPCPPTAFRLDEVMEDVQKLLVKERNLAVSIAQKLDGGAENELYQKIENQYQEQINTTLESIRLNSAAMNQIIISAQGDEELTTEQKSQKSNLEHEADMLRQKLSAVLNEKNQFRKVVNKDNPWLVLFTQVPTDVEVTREWARILIKRIDLFFDAPLTVIMKNAPERDKLLHYLSMGGEDLSGKKE